MLIFSYSTSRKVNKDVHIRKVLSKNWYLEPVCLNNINDDVMFGNNIKEYCLLHVFKILYRYVKIDFNNNLHKRHLKIMLYAICGYLLKLFLLIVIMKICGTSLLADCSGFSYYCLIFSSGGCSTESIFTQPFFLF